jgi:hypothetical protein
LKNAGGTDVDIIDNVAQIQQIVIYLAGGDAPEALPAARAWNFNRFQQAVAGGVSPIVIDRGNNLTLESYRCVMQPDPQISIQS